MSGSVRAGRATIYDAAAGKKTGVQFVMLSCAERGAGRVTQSTVCEPTATEQKRATQRLRPDEVLFKQRRAPPRYEEADYYFAHRELPRSLGLPSGDLLSALHAYIAQLHDLNSQDEQGSGSWRSMDETALIAFGVLLEEAAKATLGETGHRALLEAERSQQDGASVERAEIQKDEEEEGEKGTFAGSRCVKKEESLDGAQDPGRDDMV